MGVWASYDCSLAGFRSDTPIVWKLLCEDSSIVDRQEVALYHETGPEYVHEGYAPSARFKLIHLLTLSVYYKSLQQALGHAHVSTTQNYVNYSRIRLNLTI